MTKGKENFRAQNAALLNAIKKQPGTFREVFARAWPTFRKSYYGGEDLARMQSYELIDHMMMRGQINKIDGQYVEAPPKKKK